MWLLKTDIYNRQAFPLYLLQRTGPRYKFSFQIELNTILFIKDLKQVKRMTYGIAVFSND